MIKLLLGVFPCTFWSIAQTKNRETEPSGLGWELFENYLIAKEKFKPDFFLYENNVSASKPIKEEIKKRFKVGDGENHYIEINSALVSAQNRKRFYVHNCGNVRQPDDRGVILRDILETGLVASDKAYALTHIQGNARDYFKRHHANIAFEPVAEPVRIGDIGSTAQGYRVYSCDGKSVTINAGGGGQGGKTGLYACPVNTTCNGKSQTIKAQYGQTSIANICCYKLTYGATGVAYKTNEKPSQFSENGKDKNAMSRVYEVENGKITIKGKEYPIKLQDGFYIFRKLTVTECCRLQTLPDDYCRAVSKTQAYKGLGNGWTAEVIIHILNGALKDVPRDEKICVLSMYDGIGTGRYCLDKMGFTNVEYHAFEIDKYAMQIAQSNYPDIIEHGDAYQVRNDDFELRGDI